MASNAADPNGAGGSVTSKRGGGLSEGERETLRRVALDSIRYGLEKGEARRPLIQDVAHNASSAAFMDFRFSRLSEAEFLELDLHISLLTPLEPLRVESREDLLKNLRPGVDGLLLEDSPHRATFLPQVWGTLEDPEDFVGELFLKAGLSRDHWSKTLCFHRYVVEEF